jgi:hypothetical protein
MDENGILSYCQGCLSEATSFHTEALGRVQDSRDAYNGELYGNEEGGLSQIVMKDISRMVNGALPSIVEPFATDNIVLINSETPMGEEGAKKQTNLINYQWAKKHDPLEIVETLAFNTMVDGTSWLLSGWNSDGYPTVSVVPFEAVIPDAAAYEMKDLRFIIYRRRITIGNIIANPLWFGEHTLEELHTLSPSTATEYDPAPQPGREETYNPQDRALEQVEVFEYYGYMDINGDGIAEPVLCIWSGNKLLRSGSSPYANNPIPFDRSIYAKIPFSIYGATINDLVGDYQRLRTSITRGIIDNMANSNNGTKFIRKGSLDNINMQRLMNGEKIVELNVPSQWSADALIYDGNFNPLPADVYKMLEDTMKEEENITGITRYAVGADSRQLNQTATGISMISSMSQRRLTYIVKHMSSALRGVFTKWARFNAELIEQITIPTVDGFMEMTGYELPADQIGITVKTPTAGLVEKRQTDITRMIQALAPMMQFIGPDVVIGLVAELADTMEMPKIELQLQKVMQQLQMPKNPTPEEQIEYQKLQTEMAEAYAKMQKDIASADKASADAENTRIDTLIKAGAIHE